MYSAASSPTATFSNTNRGFADLGLGDFVKDRPARRTRTLPATELGLKHLGRPIPNVPLLAGFAALSGLIRLESVHKAISEKFSGKIAQGNIAAATEAYNMVLGAAVPA